MPSFVITFFQRDDKNRRHYRFPESAYYTMDDEGNVIDWNYGTLPETVAEMFNWFEQQPLANMLKSYGICPAFTDVCPSSMVIDIKADSEEMLDEILVTLRLFAGNDIRFAKPETLPPRRKKFDRSPTYSDPDRYARA